MSMEELLNKLAFAREEYRKLKNDNETLKQENEILTNRLAKCNESYKSLRASIQNGTRKEDKQNNPTHSAIQSTEDRREIINEIYQAHPKAKDELTTKKAISDAITKIQYDNPYQYLLERTQAYSKCLRRYKVDATHKDWRFVPSSFYFFSKEIFRESEAEWSSSFRSEPYKPERAVIKEEWKPTLEQFERALKALFPNVVEGMTWTFIENNCPEEKKAIQKWIMKEQKLKQ